MKESFDREIRERIKEEPVPVPQQVHRQIEQTLESLPEKKERRRIVTSHFSQQSINKPCLYFVGKNKTRSTIKKDKQQWMQEQP